MASKQMRVFFKRLMWVFIPPVLVFVVGVGALEAYLIHRMTHPQRTKLYGSPRDFQVIMQQPIWSEEKWKDSDGTYCYGWCLSRGRPAPAVILSHGYGSNRSEVLTLAFELWKAGYHVLLYDLRGHGESQVNWSGLGTYETDDLLSAIGFIKAMKNESGQELLDGRVGLYGVDVGGYISLIAASQNTLVKAVAVDSVYPDVAHYINYKLKTYIGDSRWANDLVDSGPASSVTGYAMQLYLMRKGDAAPAFDSVRAVTGRRYLFMTGSDAGLLQKMTREISDRAADQKQFIEIEKTRTNRLYEKAASDYDARVVAFFRDALPTTIDKPPAGGMRASAK